MNIAYKNNIKESGILLKYFGKETNDYDNAIILKWLDEQPDNMQYFNQIKKLWDLENDVSLKKKYNVKGAWNKIVKETKGIEKRKSLRGFGYYIRIAALIAIIAGTYFFYTKYITNKEIIISSANEIKQVNLPDNSLIYLNKYSTLTYKNSLVKNRIICFEGEALFNIEKNPDLPFRIEIDNVIIKVLGTSFNIKAYNNSSNILIIVKSGKVSIYKRGDSKNNKEIVLVKNQKAIVHKDKFSVDIENNLDPNYLAWKTKILTFDNERLIDVVVKLNEIYECNIVIKNHELEDKKLYATFENQSLENILNIIKATFQINYREVKDKIILYNNPNEIK